MNEPLAIYLLSVVTDPQKLADFNNPTLRNDMIDSSDLPAEDKAALKSADVATLVTQLKAGPADLQWVLVPVGTGGFAFAIGVMTPIPLLIISARTGSLKAAKARKGAKRTVAKSRRKAKGRGRG
ncbi:MAG TPA: hypothetical protein VFT24_13000 [Vicinamibacterales bacterium]|nr:hypothetical protein [Vicinamibacterales bacterium]